MLGSPWLEDYSPRQRADPPFKLLGVRLDDREGVEVDGDHAPGLDKLNSLDRRRDAHCVAVADRDEAQVGLEKLGHELHVVSQAGVPGMVETLAVELHDHSCGIALFRGVM